MQPGLSVPQTRSLSQPPPLMSSVFFLVTRSHQHLPSQKCIWYGWSFMDQIISTRGLRVLISGWSLLSLRDLFLKVSWSSDPAPTVAPMGPTTQRAKSPGLGASLRKPCPRRLESPENPLPQDTSLAQKHLPRADQGCVEVGSLGGGCWAPETHSQEIPGPAGSKNHLPRALSLLEGRIHWCRRKPSLWGHGH